MSKPSYVLALVEDRRQEQFLYRFLLCMGIKRDVIAIAVSPSGHGAAEQWVRKNFARFAKKCRNRNARAATAMFVMLDADHESVAHHAEELDAALLASGQQRINAEKDAIARLIPKWSIETWILYLSANGVFSPTLSEDISYKSSRPAELWSSLVPQAAQTLHRWTGNSGERPAEMLGSLHFALQEIPRALPVGR